MSLNREKKSEEGYPMRKLAYGEKLIALLESSQKILVVGVDHIGSSKLSQLRKMYRGRARFLFGKNTLIRRVIREYVRRTRRIQVSSLLPALRGNSCLIFLNGNPSIYEMVQFQKEIVRASRFTCAPRAGDIAPSDVFIRPMDTGLEPTRTWFFGSLNIATRISRGQIQIVSDVCVVRAGERVGASEASLLHALGMKPFSHSIEPIALYDEGECYPSHIVEAADYQKLMGGFSLGVANAAGLSMEIGHPNLLTVPHSVCSAYQMVLGLGLGGCGEYGWDGLEQVKERLETRPQVVVGCDLLDGHSDGDDDDDTTDPDVDNDFNPFDPWGGDTDTDDTSSGESGE